MITAIMYVKHMWSSGKMEIKFAKKEEFGKKFPPQLGEEHINSFYSKKEGILYINKINPKYIKEHNIIDNYSLSSCSNGENEKWLDTEENICATIFNHEYIHDIFEKYGLSDGHHLLDYIEYMYCEWEDWKRLGFYNNEVRRIE